MASSAPPPIDFLADVREIVVVHSAKGGVGKSTVAANLAVALARKGAAVGLLDGDIHGPSIAHMFGDASPPAAAPRPGSVLPRERHGVKFLSIANVAADGAPIIWRGPMVSQALGQLLGGIDWGTLDVLVVDMPPGTGDAIIGLGQSVTLSGVVSVTTPSTMSLADTYRGIQGFEQLSVPVLGLVENMSEFVCDDCGERVGLFGEGVGERASLELGIPFLGRLPIDPAVVTGSDTGTPIVATDPDGPIGRAFDAIAGALTAELASRGRGGAGDFEVTWESLEKGVVRADPPTPAAETARGGSPQTAVAVWQAADTVLGIRWGDGATTYHGTYELRKACPCAGCVEEWTGEKLPSLDQVPADVRPVRIRTVGRYALQPTWSDGHDTGIFAFRELRAGAGRVDAP